MSEEYQESTQDESLEETPDGAAERLVLILFQFVEDELQIPPWRFIERNREDGYARLVDDYFSETPVYSDNIFRRQFRMRKDLFIHIVNELSSRSPHFQQRNDALGQQSLSPLQKCTTALHQLAYGVPADFLDEYLRMGESTTIKCLYKFCEVVVELFGARYLRRSNQNDVQRLLYMHEIKHGFPGVLGSLDCMYWEWKNCLVACKGQFTRGHVSPKIVFEVVASQDLWIWDAFFGVAGSRAFGVLQARWALVRGPVHLWYKKKLKAIMLTCIILHNNIVEDEGENITDWLNEEREELAIPVQGGTRDFREYLRRNSALRDTQVHHQLRHDLLEHIWMQFGNDMK